MNKINPELQNQIEALAECCGKALQGVDLDFEEQTLPIVDTLVIGAFDRWSDVPLSNRVEEEAVDRFGELAIHRRAQLRSYCDRIQSEYEERKRWHAREPKEGQAKSKAANISSATDS